jgi:hypothetical protein
VEQLAKRLNRGLEGDESVEGIHAVLRIVHAIEGGAVSVLMRHKQKVIVVVMCWRWCMILLVE